MDEDPTVPDILGKGHVNSKNHQLYNVPIYKQVKGVGQQRRRTVEESTGGMKNPLTIVKPLKPNALDEYDKAVKKQRTKARGGKKFVEVRT
jgi:hypothetical protein